MNRQDGKQSWRSGRERVRGGGQVKEEACVLSDVKKQTMAGETKKRGWWEVTL